MRAGSPAHREVRVLKDRVLELLAESPRRRPPASVAALTGAAAALGDLPRPTPRPADGFLGLGA